MIFETLSPQIEAGRFSGLDPKTACAEATKVHQALLKERFAAGETARDLIRWRSDFIDELLGLIWLDFLSDVAAPKPSLVAVGGYGRREMHPHSDVDLLILKDPAATDCPKTDAQIAGFLQFIWDIGLRMLQPRELARAQGFPDTYILTGTKTSQVARIGNSVCPDMAEALVRANFPAAAECRRAA